MEVEEASEKDSMRLYQGGCEKFWSVQQVSNGADENIRPAEAGSVCKWLLN